MNKTIAGIVVTYNRLALLEECIEALMAPTDQSFDILIIDNASTDGTGERMQDYVRNGSIRYFNTGENSGGAGGFNYGIRKAYELGYEYFWLMDDDTIVFIPGKGRETRMKRGTEYIDTPSDMDYVEMYL
jgi:GT2 family glycosyltransferase